MLDNETGNQNNEHRRPHIVRENSGAIAVKQWLGLAVVLFLLAGGIAFSLNDSNSSEKDRGREAPFGEPPENIDATSTIGPDNEVTVAVNPRDPDNLIAGSKDYSLGPTGDGGYYVWAGYFYSKDGGRTWKDGLVGREAGSILLNYDHSSDPVVAFGPDGTAYYCGLAYGKSQIGTGRSALWIASSTDGGKTWGSPEIVMAWEGYGLFHDKQWLIVDQNNGNLYLTWTPYTVDGSRIYFGRSTDGGDTWYYYQLSSITGVGKDVQGSSIAVGTDGVLSVIWMDYANKRLMLIQNSHEGDPDAWYLPRAIADADYVSGIPNADFRVPTLPALTADPSTGPDNATLYAVWSDKRRGNSDAVIIRSADGGATWSEPVIVNDDETDHDQFFPWVAVSPGGEVGVVFYDRRDDPENTLLQTYLAWSPDGVNWLPNIRITDNVSNGSYGYHQSGDCFMGDYIGLAISENAAHPVWADTRLGWGKSHLFTARMELEELRKI